jgi:type II restriction/modification system DNA methylase subunit YeeA
MQTPPTYRTNRDLFANYYLDEHLPETEAWNEFSEAELQDAKEEITDLWEREKGTAPKRNESQLEEKFIRPMFQQLGIPFEVEESTSRSQRRPDYGFFESEDAARNAFDRRDEGGDFYEDTVAVADAKRWGRPLDTRASGEHERDFENPSYQIHVYLQETPVRWAVLTDGRKWRLYYGPTSHRLDSYYEIDLPTVLEKGDPEDFKYFYLFFRHGAFLEDASGDCFLDDVYGESNVFAQELGEDLQDNIYEAIKVLSEGLLQYSGNNLTEDDLDLIHDSSLIYLYRLIFVLYAEAEGRELLDTSNEIYEQTYSLNSLKKNVTDELESPNTKYRDWQTNLWSRLDELFQLIDQGSKSRGIPEEDLYIPAYNGGLFRTKPDNDDSPEARFLAEYEVGDAYLARVIELLTRSQNGNGEGKIFVDYSSLDVRHLGSIYEGLLEYKLNVAAEPLALDDGEYVIPDEGDEVVVEEDDVYLTTDSGERKATGSYYTPEYIVEYIIENTLGPLIDDIREDLVGYDSYTEGGFAEEFAREVFDLKILDPAMGSGHFLTSVVDYLSREIIDAQERQAKQQGVETIGREHDINWARRQVAQHCIYGVDQNPLAVELTKVSLWLRTLAAEQPLAFLDHHPKTGNSLVGSDIEDIDQLETDADDGPNATLSEFGVVRRGTIEYLMDVYEEFIAIENTELSDAKEMERKYREIEHDDLRNRLVALANVKTAEEFGLDLPSGAYERMAGALSADEEWAAVEEQDWFWSAQATSEEWNFMHWKLAFPEVFYEIDGSDQENPGFDAVIGNPPYVRMEAFKAIKSFLRQNYDVHTDRMDLYGYFIEQAVNLVAEGKYLGYIVSNKWLRANYGEPIRDMIVDCTAVRRVVNFKDLPVFDEARTYPLVFVVSKEQAMETEGMAATVPHLDFSDLSALVDDVGVSFQQEYLREAGWAMLGNPAFSLLARIQREHPRLADYIKSPPLRGVVSGLNEAFIIDKETRDELIEQDQKSDEIIHPLRTGRDVRRYWLEDPGTYLIYTHHDVDIDRYPAIETHLGPFRERLEDRATEQAWYELQQPQKAYKEKFEQPKIIQPDLAERVRFHLDTEGHYPTNKIYFLPTDDPYLLAILNSQLANVHLASTSAAYRGGYIQLLGQYVEELPIREITFETPDAERGAAVTEAVDAYEIAMEQSAPDGTNQLLNIVDTHLTAEPERAGVIHDLLVELVERMSEHITERKSLNLSLLDYLGNYADGPTIGESYQPPTGLADSILTNTTEDNEKLKFGTVTIAENGQTLVVRATTRYKPDRPEEYDTDQYGYTETDPEPVMEFVDLSEAERILLDEFVPHAVDEGSGFAGFRENATKTNSPIDRLEALTLPQLADVEDGLERYRRTKARAEELDEKIAKTDEVIDQIVYQLYGLSDEEIEIVELSPEEG